MEVWADIKELTGLYQVSNIGNVRSLPRTITYKDGRVYTYLGTQLKVSAGSGGYTEVNLSRYGRFSVHRLVAIAFIPNPENKPEVNHKDGVKSNNHYLNLEWVTGPENKLHAMQLGLVKRKLCLTKKQIELIKTLLNKGRKGAHLARLHGVSTATISKIKNNKGAFS